MGLALIPGLPTLGAPELIIALVVILLLFGAKRIPELARGLGSGVREFRAGTKEGQIEDKKNEEKKDEEEASASDEKDDARLEDDSSVEESSGEAEKAEQKRS